MKFKMGNIVGTIYYDPVDHSRFGYIICGVRAIHKLEQAKPKHMISRSDKRWDGAVISGRWVKFYGVEIARRKMKKFLEDCKRQLESAGATGVEISY